MKLLLDTNVILDVFFERAEFQDYAKQIFYLVEQKHYCGCVSSTAVTDIYYMARRQFHDNEMAFEVICKLSKLFKIIKTDEKIVKNALKLHWADFEDAVQYVAAKKSKIKAIITRNKDDYSLSKIPVYTPAEFIALFT